jgi:hypothetical protein
MVQQTVHLYRQIKVVAKMFVWDQNFSDWLVYTVMGISQNSKHGIAINLYMYDTII